MIAGMSQTSVYISCSHEINVVNAVLVKALAAQIASQYSVNTGQKGRSSTVA